MSLRTASAAVCMVLLSAAVCWAAACPLCLQAIPEGEKYCQAHKAEMLAKTISSAEEAKLAAATVEARAVYRARLEELQKFYKERGNAEGLQKVEAELAGLRRVPQFSLTRWEEGVVQLSAVRVDEEANALLAKAEAIMAKLNPFGRGARLSEAAVVYREILLQHPDSTATTRAAFQLGEIYSSVHVKEYERAVTFYELSYLSDPKKDNGALLQAAQVCDNHLSDYGQAARFYWMAAHRSDSLVTRQRALTRLKQLQKSGFGTKYTVGDVPQEPGAETEQK